MAEYRYQKICQLSRCQKVFGTNRKWQKFCKRPHAIEYNQIEIRNTKILANRVKALEEEILKKKKENSGRS